MKNPKNVVYSFERYLVEVAERRLWRGDELVAITPKAFDTLIVLLENRGRIVEKDALLSEVWQDTFVEESTLAQNISTLRKTLGTVADGTPFIETVPRHGYRFIADVKEVIGNDEIIVVNHRVRTQVTAEHERFSDETHSQPETNLAKTPPKTSFSQTLILRLRQNYIGSVIIAVLFCLTLTAVVIAVRDAFQPARSAPPRFAKVEVSKITANGNINLVAVSPDGKYLAYVEKKGENQSLQLRQFDNSTTIEILPPKKQTFVGCSFSRDGRQIYYAAYDLEPTPAGDLMSKLYRIPLFGGVPQEIIADVDSPPAISPDGQQVAFTRNNLQDNQTALIVASLAEKNEKTLLIRRLGGISTGGAEWSPDGRTIVAGVSKNALEMDLLAVDAVSGAEKSLTSETWQWIGQPKFTADGSSIIFPAFTGRAGNQGDEIWQINYPETGTARKITGAVNGIYGIALTADSKSIIAVKSDRLSSFWTAAAEKLNQPTQITQNLSEYNVIAPGLNWTPDGKIIYGSTLNGDLDLWLMDTADGSHKKQITADGRANSMPVVTPDNQQIIFVSNRSGRRNLWRVKIDGSDPRQLTDETGIASPSLSPDGKTVYYTALDPPTSQVYLHKISIDGGASVQMNNVKTYLPQISPDGKWLVCYSPTVSNGKDISPNELRLTVLAADDAKIVKQFEIVSPWYLKPVKWLDVRTFSYATDSGAGSRLWRQRLDQTAPQMILETPTETIFRFAWSPDGKNLIYEKGKAVNDLILIKSIED